MNSARFNIHSHSLGNTIPIALRELDSRPRRFYRAALGSNVLRSQTRKREPSPQVLPAEA